MTCAGSLYCNLDESDSRSPKWSAPGRWAGGISTVRCPQRGSRDRRSSNSISDAGGATREPCTGSGGEGADESIRSLLCPVIPSIASALPPLPVLSVFFNLAGASMVSLRFPFSSFPQPPRRPGKLNSSGTTFRAAVAAAAAATTAGVGVGLAITLKMANPSGNFLPKWSGGASPIWASLSLSDAGAAAGTSVESKTGAEFPNVLGGTRRLLGVGLRKKNLFGLKSIDVYAFGVYADDNDVKKLREKYGTLTISQLQESKELHADILEQDLRMTVRLQIVYSRLSIRSVRSAFEQSVGSRLQKFSGSDNKELLQRFTSLFKDEYKIPRGSTIDLSREQGYILHTKKGVGILFKIASWQDNILRSKLSSKNKLLTSGPVKGCPEAFQGNDYKQFQFEIEEDRAGSFDGNDVGSIQSKLLCQSILDLYIGDDPFDKRAKEEVGLSLASLLQN
ncbi:hypothetical protein Taro_015789 [Colocasia esculenta]|uniref:Chalcone--flavanone isomerase n=1 Tax=Colocasia esculenta TaxID=4460 RepID=A0A843UIV4_COLES|nr:hypothetical protein [Colocasia esculenta]